THLRGERGVPVTTQQLVAEHLSGPAGAEPPDLLVMLGPSSELGWAATLRRDDLARAVLQSWQEITEPAQLLVEVVSHRVPGSGAGAGPPGAGGAALAAPTRPGGRAGGAHHRRALARPQRCSRR